MFWERAFVSTEPDYSRLLILNGVRKERCSAYSARCWLERWRRESSLSLHSHLDPAKFYRNYAFSPTPTLRPFCTQCLIFWNFRQHRAFHTMCTRRPTPFLAFTAVTSHRHFLHASHSCSSSILLQHCENGYNRRQNLPTYRAPLPVSPCACLALGSIFKPQSMLQALAGSSCTCFTWEAASFQKSLSASIPTS